MDFSISFHIINNVALVFLTVSPAVFIFSVILLETASHMAEVAYDKHTLFCEEYVDKLQKALQEIYRDGASKNSINIGRELVNIRQNIQHG